MRKSGLVNWRTREKMPGGIREPQEKKHDNLQDANITIYTYISSRGGMYVYIYK